MRPRLSIAISRKPQEQRILHRFVERGVEHLGQVLAVHLAGQRIEARQIGEPLLALVTLVDDAHDAVGAQRLAVAARRTSGRCPRPRLLCRSSPVRAHIRPDMGRRCPLSAAGRRHRPRRSGSVRSSGRRVGHSRGRWRSRRYRRCRSTAAALAPQTQHVGIEPPVVRDLTDRAEDVVGIEARRRRRRERSPASAGAEPARSTRRHRRSDFDWPRSPRLAAFAQRRASGAVFTSQPTGNP